MSVFNANASWWMSVGRSDFHLGTRARTHLSLGMKPPDGASGLKHILFIALRAQLQGASTVDMFFTACIKEPFLMMHAAFQRQEVQTLLEASV